MIDLNIISQDWFTEISVNDEPNLKKEEIEYSLYESCCPELLGNMNLTLYKGIDKYYYMRISIKEPIGDYGSHWVDYWYKSDEEYNSSIDKILNDILD